MESTIPGKNTKTDGMKVSELMARVPAVGFRDVMRESGNSDFWNACISEYFGKKYFEKMLKNTYRYDGALPEILANKKPLPPIQWKWVTYYELKKGVCLFLYAAIKHRGGFSAPLELYDTKLIEPWLKEETITGTVTIGDYLRVLYSLEYNLEEHNQSSDSRSFDAGKTKYSEYCHSHKREHGKVHGLLLSYERVSKEDCPYIAALEAYVDAFFFRLFGSIHPQTIIRY